MLFFPRLRCAQWEEEAVGWEVSCNKNSVQTVLWALAPSREDTHTHTLFPIYSLSLYPSLLLYRYVLHVARGCRWSGAAGRQLYYIRGRGIEPERFSCERPTLWNDPPYTHPNGQTSPTPKSAVFYWGDIYKSFIGGT